MKRLACLLLLVATPAFCDTLWVLTGVSNFWGKTPILDLTVPASPNGEATNVTSWSVPMGTLCCYEQFGDITDYLEIFWPSGPNLFNPPDSFSTPDTDSPLPFSVVWGGGGPGYNGLGSAWQPGGSVYSYIDYGQRTEAQWAAYGPFTVADPPMVPEPATFFLLLIGLAFIAWKMFRLAAVHRN